MARTEALWRIGAFFYAYIASIIAIIGSILAMVYAVIDLAVLLVTGSELSMLQSVKKWAYRLIMWPIRLMNYALLGKGSFMWTP